MTRHNRYSKLIGHIQQSNNSILSYLFRLAMWLSVSGLYFFLFSPCCIIPFYSSTGKSNIQRLHVADMVGVGEMLASAVVKTAVSQLLLLAQASMGGPVTRIRNFKKDLDDMVSTLQLVEAAISDAEKRSVNDNVTRIWLKDLKKAAYEISDMLDEFQLPNDQPAAMPQLQPPTLWYKVRLSISFKD
jgi:hypothetical protein